jgi:gamma-glutamyltranspeptidase
MTPEERIANLENTMQQMADHYWRFQGRINALELIATLATLDFAKLQPNPFQYVQEYVEAMRQTTKGLTPDVDDPSKAPRLASETRHAIDDYLQQLVGNAGQLKGAPGNP